MKIKPWQGLALIAVLIIPVSIYQVVRNPHWLLNRAIFNSLRPHRWWEGRSR